MIRGIQSILLNGQLGLFICRQDYRIFSHRSKYVKQVFVSATQQQPNYKYNKKGRWAFFVRYILGYRAIYVRKFN